VPPARKSSTICRTDASPSRPPWKASTKTTFCGQEHAGNVTASASGTTASQGRPVSRLIFAK
jgi:D-arabinose 1-dehydrogenase-like Zn-dependent alcohol dehydrogenase